MAKEKKEAGAAVTASTQEVTESNVMENIKNQNKMPNGISDEVLKKIEDDKKKKQMSELEDAILTANYENYSALLNLRQRRREEKVTKQYLTDTKTLLVELKDGKITPTEYKTRKVEIEKHKREGMSQAANEYDNELKELRNLHPDYRYRW